MTAHEEHLKAWFDEAIAAATSQAEINRITAQYKMQIAVFQPKKVFTETPQ
jgi:hypothetical protein